MNFDLKSTLKIASVSLILLFIIGYSLFEFRWVIQGPIIDVESPINGESVQDNLMEVSGKVKNVSHLSLNDYQITMDTNGLFKEKLLLSPGYNIVKLEVKDRFGRNEELLFEVLYLEQKNS